MKDLIITGVREARVTAEEFPELAAVGIPMVGLTRVSATRVRRSRDSDKQWGHLQVTIAGQVQVWVQRTWAKLPPRSAYINPPGSDWSWRYNERTGAPWQTLFVRFVNGPTMPIPPDRHESYVVRNVISDDLLWTFHQLHRESISAVRPLVIRGLAEFVAYFARQLIHPTEATTELAQLWMTVSGDLSGPWTLRKLCATASMSPEKLRLASRKETGRSPMHQLAYLRMRRAAELLTETHQPVQQISRRVGYENAFNFSSAFKRHFGCSPRQFRRDRGPRDD
jgi:AraC-like DNA-binding protein